MSRNHALKTQHHKEQHQVHDSPPHSDLGGRLLHGKPAAALSFWKREAKKVAETKIDLTGFQLANDNLYKKLHLRPRALSWVASIAVFMMTLTMNSTTIATQTIMHTDSRALARVMDVSPNALATVLNHMDVGE